MSMGVNNCEKQVIRLGYAPTRRDVFSRQEAGVWEAILAKIRDLGRTGIVDIDWLNDEGHCIPTPTWKRWQRLGIKASMRFQPPYFGTESAVAKLVTPWQTVLLGGRTICYRMGPEAAILNAVCLPPAKSRYDVPFTYAVNSCIDSPVFENGFRTFRRSVGG